mgnify:FL=1
MTTYEKVIKKYNIKVGTQYIVDIPDMGRDDMAKLFAELGFNVGAEVGVENGYYSEVLLKANPKLQLYGVDPWSAGAYEVGTHAVDTEQKKYDERYETAVKLLKPYNFTIIRKGSMEALADFKDNSLDFVYIDANHDFPNFTNDLHNWIKKVRPGGIVSGHDYAYFSYKKANHVKRALQAYARCYRMIPLFIVGAETYDKGFTRDKYRSWFWVKP